MDTEHHIELFIKNFVLRDRRDRFLTLLRGSTRMREKVGIIVDHPEFYVTPFEDVAHRLRGKPESYKIQYVPKRLSELGAPRECVYWNGFDDVADALILPLRDAVSMTLEDPSAASIVSCVPGQLAYYQGDMCDECYIFRAKRK